MSEPNPKRDQQQPPREPARGPETQGKPDDKDWESGIARGEEYGREGERERAQADVYGQEQARSAGPRGEREREDPPQGWYGRQRPPTPGKPKARQQGGEGGLEQSHRGGYEKGYRGSQSGYDQAYEQYRGDERAEAPQSYGGPGYDDADRSGRAPGARQPEEADRSGLPGSPPGRGHRGRGPKNYVRSDERISEEISDRLMESDDVDPSEVEVHVEHGEVILRGTAHSKEEKRRMEDIAGAVLGVEEVLNHLRIRRRDDQGREEWSREPSSGPRG
jgi:hypothetical protein